MLSNNTKITALIYENAIEKYAKTNNISLQEAKAAISIMPFKQYLKLLEDGSNLIPPSGQPIGYDNSVKKPNSPATSNVTTWTSNALPMAKDMIVGVTSANGMPEEGTVTDISPDLVKVRGLNGQEQSYNPKDPRLVPVAAKKPVPVPATNTQTQQQTQLQPQTPNQVQEEKDLARLKHLAGIAEDCSGGASGASGIAVMATEMAPLVRRRGDIHVATGSVEGADSGKRRATKKLSTALADEGKVQSASRSYKSASNIDYHRDR